MKYIADFHVHSKHSRATAKNLDLENLYTAAQTKGISVIGTGDFTHPAWWQEIKEKLDPVEEGLFALKPDIAQAFDKRVPPACRRTVRFMLVTEISNIYKKNGRTRKNHNLVFMPDLNAAERFNRTLDKVGNIRSDGRPILGLDARNLLEIVLETSSTAYLVPAHIWTPWFSLLGSKSGFDSIEECFEDLSPHIFALETGLSSDPQMNWRISSLDRFTLISNSDAHSPAKVGREANCFNADLSFAAIRDALSGVDARGFEGTIEFFPEEGKYHIDGHHACDFRCLPSQTRDLGRKCPVCGKPLVLGVLYRVEELADRAESQRPISAKPYTSLIPLEEILAEIFQSGAATKRVAVSYARLLERYGAEFDILRALPREDLDRSGISLLGEAVERMRRGAIHFEPGYDGIYGRLRIFDDDERERLKGQTPLFRTAADQPCTQVKASVPFMGTCVDPPSPEVCRQPNEAGFKLSHGPFALNIEQQQVVDHPQGPILIAAGPGTGKTRTITGRMAALIKDREVAAENILAVTFTNKAAREMCDRLAAELPKGAALPAISTFHGLGRSLLLERPDVRMSGIVDDVGRAAIMSDALKRAAGAESARSPTVVEAVEAVVLAKQHLLTFQDDLSHLTLTGRTDHRILARIYEAYQDILGLQNLFDFEDLIFKTVKYLETDETWRLGLQRRFVHIFVDEFQDINYSQYRLIRLIAPGVANLCVIGDPDQAIYGFRGSDVRFFKQFAEDYPSLRSICLTRNYRSTDSILQAAYQVVNAPHRNHDAPLQTFSGIKGEPTLSVLEASSTRAEAVLIGKTIEQMVGGAGFHAIDFGKIRPEQTESSFADFAILYRTSEQGCLIGSVLEQAGIPCQQVSRQIYSQHPGIVQLMSLLRIMIDQGSYMDFNHMIDLTVPSISRETLDAFKMWAYAARQPLPTALGAATRMPITGLSLARQQRLAALIGSIRALKSVCAGRTVADIIEHCVMKTTLAGRIETEALQTLIESAVSFQTDLAAFVIEQAMRNDTDMYRPDVEKVALMTLHASKGLEFNFVFIAGCEDGLIPLNRPGGPAGDPDEERRLLFVGMTRAKKRLFLTWARRRTIYGTTCDQRCSAYVDDIEPHLKSFTASTIKKRVQQQLTLF